MIEWLKRLKWRLREILNFRHKVKTKCGEEIWFYESYRQNKVIFDYILAGNLYEEDLLEYIRSLNIKSGWFVDIGGFIGTHSLYFAKCCKAAKVIAFEPQAWAFRQLSKNIKLNAATNIEPRNMALGSVNGTSGIQVRDEKNLGASKISVGAGQIPLKRLDDLNLPKCDLLKIDVEGFEYDVLLGARETLKKFHPHIFVELWDKEVCERDGLDYTFDKVKQYLEELGYKIERKAGLAVYHFS